MCASETGEEGFGELGDTVELTDAKEVELMLKLFIHLRLCVGGGGLPYLFAMYKLNRIT